MTSLHSGWLAGSLAIALAFISPATTARANVYATDIQANGNLISSTSFVNNAITITYRLNQAADQGVTVNILKGGTVAASIAGGTAMGLNTVTWTPTATGTYSVSIITAATGFPIWTQTSIDTNAGMPAYYVFGIAVDKNTNSPYYGRVLMGNCQSDQGDDNPFVPAFARQDGIYKMNADGTYADEGGFGNAGYTEDDAGDAQASPSQMPESYGFDPMFLRIGDDDRCYWNDDSIIGKIVSCDMRATVNQTVIQLDNGYGANPDIGDLGGGGGFGVQQFDITGTATTSAAVWLTDFLDSPNWGVWMFHLVGGPGNWVVDPSESEGTQAVQTIYDNFSSSPHPSDLVESGGGCSVDANLDIFVSYNQSDPGVGVYDSMEYTNWNGSVLPPDNSDQTLTEGLTNNQVAWGEQAATNTDYSWEAIRDTVINSQTAPTLVALPMMNGNNNGNGGGVKVINAVNASITITSATLNGTALAINFVSSSPYTPVLSQLSLAGSGAVAGPYTPVTATITGGFGVFQATTTISPAMNFYQVKFPATQGTVVTVENSGGAVTQSLTNMDWGNAYSCAAWDNVGNLYAASTTTNCWRVWSPPGANTSTTAAVVKMIVQHLPVD
jgi:hypothetical protein